MHQGAGQSLETGKGKGERRQPHRHLDLSFSQPFHTLIPEPSNNTLVLSWATTLWSFTTDVIENYHREAMPDVHMNLRGRGLLGQVPY